MAQLHRLARKHVPKSRAVHHRRKIVHAKNLLKGKTFGKRLHGLWNRVEKSTHIQAKTKGSLMKYIKSNPFTAMGGALLVGAVCALMLRK